MIDNITLKSIIQCKRNNVAELVSKVKSDTAEQTSENLDEFLAGYYEATSKMLELDGPPGMLDVLNVDDMGPREYGYKSAWVTICGIIAWENRRDCEELMEKEKMEKEERRFTGNLDATQNMLSETSRTSGVTF